MEESHDHNGASISDRNTTLAGARGSMDIFAIDPILKVIYPGTEPQQVRSVPMEVLAVGISRSGTESLRSALMQLGYDHCYHGWDTAVLPRFQHLAWWRLLRRKYRPLPNDPAWTARDFDGLLGHCRAISDLPAAVFAEQLIQAYPEAKVILNKRTDLDAWFRSFDRTMGALDESWIFWVAHFFNSELFWIIHVMAHGFLGKFFKGSWRAHGKEVYQEHIQRVRDLNLADDKLLEWSVEEGWQPLCAFLGKEVPDAEFPNGNTPADWESRIESLMKERLKSAFLNMALVFGAVGAVVIGIWYMLAKR